MTPEHDPTHAAAPNDAARIRELEERLRQSESRYAAEVLDHSRQLEAMYEAAVNAILTIDTRAIIHSVNPATVQLLGYAHVEMIGRNVSMIMPEPYASAHDGYLAAYLSTGRRKIIGIGREVMARRKDGSTFPIHLAVSEFKASGRRLFTGIITDLTERKSAEVALRETERKLAQAQKMEAVGQLTGGLAHDFNNLLTVITGNLELLEMRLENETDRDLLRRADEAARMGARLTSRLLTFSRRRKLQPTIVNLNEATVGMTELLRRSLGENITVSTRLAPDLWSTRVDAGEIENAILNLAINARDAMPGGGRILIETSNAILTSEDLAQAADIVPGEFVRLAVSDTGTGMAPEVVARAFEPFFTTKEPGRGTGLGLSTLYGFVRESGGHVVLYSEVARGTMVSIYLPRDANAGGGDVRAVHGGPPAPAMGEHVLIVEDNDQVRELTRRRLEALGYRTHSTASGAEALALLETGASFDLVLSDVVMPGGVSGFDVARWVKEHRPGMGVLLTSGFAPEMAGQQHGQSPDVPMLRKPYAQPELAQAVRAALKR